MNQNEELWKPEDGYPPLCPPESLKEDLLRDEDFTEVDRAARDTPATLRDSFNQLVVHLTSHLNSDLHKLRSIFVWMGANKVGSQEETERCENNDSPRYYLKEAYTKKIFIGILFAKMCRYAKIPCILVSGKAKGASYDPGDKDIKAENTWAVVYVAGSWRFVFPYWAFVKASGHQKENWMLVEDCGNAVRTSFAASAGTTIPDFDEFYFLTDPEVMNYECHPYDEDKQLLTEPWTQEKFFELPFFNSLYFSSGWQLISPLTCVINSTSGWCLIDLFSPGAGYKLKYKMFFDEARSGRNFPQEIQTDRYVTITKRTEQTKSFLVRLPINGTYKFEAKGAHEGKTTNLVTFRIVCDTAAPETQPLPSYPENGFGFSEEAAEAGLSEPSHTEGIMPVKSSEEVSIHFKVKDDVDILARLVHSTRTPEELRDNIIVQREADKATVIARLPADDPTPEYSLEIDIIKNIKETDKSIKELTTSRVLNYLLTSDDILNAVITDKDKKETLQCYEDAWVSIGKDDAEMLEKAASRVEMAGIKDTILNQTIQKNQAKYQRMREEMLAAARERNLDPLNKALKKCMSVNLQNKGDLEDATRVLMALCQEEMEKAVKNENSQELHECINKIASTCIGKMAREEAWFQEGKEVLWRVEDLQEARGIWQSLRSEDKLPDHVVDVIVAAFILLGESEEELDTWQKVYAKLKETNAEQLLNEVNSLDNSSLTPEQVDLAKMKLERPGGTFNGYRPIETLKKMCLKKITFHRTRGSLVRRH